MKQLLSIASLSALSLVSYGSAHATPCNPNNHICYLNGVNHSYFAHNTWGKLKKQHVLHTPQGQAYLSKSPRNTPRPVQVYVGAMAGVNFLHANGSDSIKMNGATALANIFDTNKTNNNVVYGAFVGLSFYGKKAKWLNGFHPEFSVWQTGTSTINGHVTWYNGITPNKYTYHYKASVRAMALNALFDFVSWKDLRLMAGGGVNLGQVETSNFTRSGGKTIVLSVPNYKDAHVFYDLKLGAGVHFLSHVQANVVYTYYPTFAYRTGAISSFGTHPPIKADLSMQNVMMSLAYTF